MGVTRHFISSAPMFLPVFGIRKRRGEFQGLDLKLFAYDKEWKTSAIYISIYLKRIEMRMSVKSMNLAMMEYFPAELINFMENWPAPTILFVSFFTVNQSFPILKKSNGVQFHVFQTANGGCTRDIHFSIHQQQSYKYVAEYS